MRIPFKIITDRRILKGLQRKLGFDINSDGSVILKNDVHRISLKGTDYLITQFAGSDQWFVTCKRD